MRVSGLAMVCIESRAVPSWRNTFEPTSRIQPEMLMICSTNGIAVATIAVVIVPAFQPASAMPVIEPTKRRVEHEEQRPHHR